MKLKVINLGCPKNLVDAEFLAGSLKASGAEFVSSLDEADVLLVNTCGFIRAAKEESIETILDAVELKKRGVIKRLYVTGCLSERYGPKLEKEIPEVDGFFGNSNLPKVVTQLAQQLELQHYLVGERLPFTPPHYAYLKISEGCDNPCTFCAIPKIRGHFRSRPMDELIAEARSLAERGVKELILIGQDTTMYSRDLSGRDQLPELLRRLCHVEGLEWIRVLYTFPAHVTDELVDVIAEEKKICKYVDVPIQHISSKLLKRMARKMDRKGIESLIQRLRDRIPGVALRTSLIVGFPGETEQDFQELADFVAEAKFERLGVFTYSREEDTPAYDFPNQVPEKVKRQRWETIMEIQRAVADELNERLIGREVRVLVDEWDAEAEVYVARSEWDCPEIDNTVLLPEEGIQVGMFYRVQVEEAEAYDLWARVSHSEYPNDRGSSFALT